MTNDGYDATQRVQVAQAQGMISVQVPCTIDEAQTLLGARARSSNLTVAQIAAAVVAGDIRFD